MATGFGLVPVRNIRGGKSFQVNTYYVPSTDSTALKVGDVVELVNAMDPKNEVAVIKKLAADTNLPVGPIVGFLPDPSLLYTGHMRPASTNRYVLVCDDVDAVFEAQEDAVGGSVSAASVGSHFNISLITAAGSTVTGLSGDMLDSSTAVATALNCKIVGIKRDGVNAAAQSGGAILEVIFLQHALNTADSIT